MKGKPRGHCRQAVYSRHIDRAAGQGNPAPAPRKIAPPERDRHDQRSFIMPVRLDAVSAQHLGDRQEQQDRVFVCANPRVRGAALALVADGAGGHKGGAAAAEQVMRTARQLFENWSPHQESAQTLLAAIVDEAHTVIRLNRALTEEEPHSTLVAILVQENRADWVHVGDSRLYHYAGANLRTRTRDHSFVEAQIRQGQWNEADRHRHPNRNLLLQALGHSETPQPDFGQTPALRDGDAFLLCSDGLWDYFSDAELGKALYMLAPRQAAETLINAARKRSQGRGDNVSLAILKFAETNANTATPRD